MGPELVERRTADAILRATNDSPYGHNVLMRAEGGSMCLFCGVDGALCFAGSYCESAPILLREPALRGRRFWKQSANRSMFPGPVVPVQMPVVRQVKRRKRR